MLKKNKNLILILFILVIIVGCRPPTSSSDDTSSYREGTVGLVMNFLSGAPPDKMFADSPYDIEIPISIEVRNKGAYPTADDDAGWNENSIIFISGFDTNIIESWKIIGQDPVDTLSSGYPYIKLQDKAYILEGKNINNPEGGYDLLEFVGTADLGDINVEKYTPNFLVTACYDYKTKASPNVCIDPRPFTTVKEKKVCDIHDISLKDQGAPVAVTKVESKALSNSLQFKIHFKNVGKGDVIATDVLEKCSGKDDAGKLEKRHVDFVRINNIKIGTENLDCGQLISVDDNDGYARLINNEGFIVCNLEDYKEGVESAYTTPLYIELAYGYRDSISKSVEIVKVPEP